MRYVFLTFANKRTAISEWPPNPESYENVHHFPWKLSTPCVEPLADAKKRIKRELVLDQPRLDLDMDGELDWVITTDADATRFSGYMYLARGVDCAHFAGEWTGSVPEPINNEGKVLVAVSPCPVDCCTNVTETRYVWDGRVYEKQATVKKTVTCKERKWPTMVAPSSGR